MKKAFLLVIFFVLTLNSMQSQVQQIAVQHPTLDTARFFGNLQNAIDSAWVGSTIYLPAILGDYTTSGFTVNKKLFIYGVGHYPDSTQATGRTVISGNVTISQGADSGSISGLYITGNVTFTSVNVFYFNRNRLQHLLFNSSTKNILLQQNVVAGYVNGGNAEKCIFENNFFANAHYYFTYLSPLDRYIFLANLHSCIFLNNIFFKTIGNRGNYGAHFLANVNYTVFENNIFLINDGNSFDVGYFILSSSYNTFNNNIFETSNPIPTGTNVGQDNIVLDTHAKIFKNQSGQEFNYSHNYQLPDDCPGKDAGTDGKDIGIYGGDKPYKNGAVPIIPHILKREISPRVVKDGKINIEMIIEAQTR